jgi:uncharacterized protein (UPF0333 family)
MLTGHQSLYSIAAQVLVAVITIIAATVLGYAGKIEGEAITALFGMAIGLAGGTAAVVSHASSAQATSTPTRITTREGTTVETNGAIGTITEPGGED